MPGNKSLFLLNVGVDAALVDSRFTHGLFALFVPSRPTLSFDLVAESSSSPLESKLRFLNLDKSFLIALLLPAAVSDTGVSAIDSFLLRSANSCSRFKSANLRNIIRCLKLNVKIILRANELANA